MAAMVGNAISPPCWRIFFSRKRATSCSVCKVFLGSSCRSAANASLVSLHAFAIFSISSGVFSSRNSSNFADISTNLAFGNIFLILSSEATAKELLLMPIEVALMFWDQFLVSDLTFIPLIFGNLSKAVRYKVALSGVISKKEYEGFIWVKYVILGSGWVRRAREIFLSLRYCWN